MAVKYNWIRFRDSQPADDILPRGTVAEMRVGGRLVCMANHKGKLFAIENNCPHAGGHLSYGKMNAEGEVACPLHRFCFDVKTGKNTSGEGYYVDSYPIEYREDGIFVGIPKKSWFNIFG